MSRGTGHGHRHVGHDAAQSTPARPPLAFVGAGHVGTALAVAFSRAGWPVAAVASRDPGRRARFEAAVPGVHAFAEPSAVLDDADIVFLTVPDDAIAPVAAGLRLYSGQALVHTSGSLPATVLEPAMAAGTTAGSFHPLVAFADLDRALDALPNATIAVEGDERLLSVLAALAAAVGAQPVRIPPGGKAAYHAAAVLAAGGFVALLDAIARLASTAGLDETGALAIYGPLIRQGLANADRIGIAAALTGPIVRGDAGTVRAHIDAMTALAPDALEVYIALARRESALAEARGDLSPERAATVRELLDAAR